MTELASTYPVEDKNNQEELKRLTVQDHMLTKAMGGVLPEQKDLSHVRRVLDIGCGTGGWILETAQKYPHIEKLCGNDISTAMVQYALEQAKLQQLSVGVQGRVEFLVMDALRMLEFPENYFDLVNLRLGVSFMRQWEWPKMFSEMHRVLKPGGIVRIVEGTIGFCSESEALNEFYALLRCAFFRSGRLFREEPTGLIDELPEMFRQNGFQNIESCQREVEYRTGTEIVDAVLQNIIMLSHTFRQFFYRYGRLPEHYDMICQQVVKDLQQPDFIFTGTIYTFWAVNPY